MPRLRLCLLWHMHQPMYRDPESGEYILPWVRLHATRSYYDMARVVSEFEGARAVFNLVPSLLVQLDEYGRGAAKDRFLELTRKRAETLTPGEREFILRSFFMTDWEMNVRPLPRYWELLHKRGRDLRGVDLPSSAESFSAAELRDLQVLANLAWMGFRAEQEEEVVVALRRKGRDFTEDDKRSLLEAQLRIVGKVVAAYRELAAAGQAELTVTPFFHPILPLLVDSNSALRAMPQATLPPRFGHPEDAREQVRRALDYAQAHLGVRPVGMWPAEGAVSPEAVAILAEQGARWCATDEGVLLRSRPRRERTEANLHRPYRMKAGDREITLLFRDRELSELISSGYATQEAKESVDDLLGRLQRVAESCPDGEPPLVTLALDGENPWEHYPHSGRDFLRELYGRLGRGEGGVELVTAGDHLAQHPPTERIDELHSGSWIDSDFQIWIGKREENQAWTLLGQARTSVAEKAQQVAEGAGPSDLAEKVSAARDALLPAEGSDWFWWFGDDFFTDTAAEFDALFRGHLKAAWRALGEPVPARLEEPISQQVGSRLSAALQEPQAFVHPRLDGRIRSYFDWTGAGICRASPDDASQLRGEGPFAWLYFGFDLQHLFVRLDPRVEPRLVPERAGKLVFLLGSGERRWEIELPVEPGESQPLLFPEGRHARQDAAEAKPLGRASFRDIFEASFPFERLGLVSADRVALAVKVLKDGALVERIPRHGFLTFSVPDADYERKNWKA